MVDRMRNKRNRGVRERVWCRGRISLRGGERHGGDILGKNGDRRVVNK